VAIKPCGRNPNKDQMKVNFKMNSIKAKHLLCIVFVSAFATHAGAEPPKMKMTTQVPDGIATPNKLETSIGTLTAFDGVPDAETTQKVYDNLDLNRATEAFLNCIPISSMHALKHGLLKHGPANTTAVLFEELMDSKALWLTPNTTSVYMASWLELGDEPMVIETPPNVLGFINNAWFKYVVDFGNAGPDKGKGGKFLIVPPGYKSDVPEGYHVAHTTTHGNWVIWRITSLFEPPLKIPFRCGVNSCVPTNAPGRVYGIARPTVRGVSREGVFLMRLKKRMSFDTPRLSQTHFPVPYPRPTPGPHLPPARPPRLDWQYSNCQQMKHG
jgi:hypothetical protein